MKFPKLHLSACAIIMYNLASLIFLTDDSRFLVWDRTLNVLVVPISRREILAACTSSSSLQNEDQSRLFFLSIFLFNSSNFWQLFHPVMIVRCGGKNTEDETRKKPVVCELLGLLNHDFELHCCRICILLVLSLIHI